MCFSLEANLKTMKNKGNIALWTLVAIIILAAILVLGSESKKKMQETNTPVVEENAEVSTQIQEDELSNELDSIEVELNETDTESLDEGM